MQRNKQMTDLIKKYAKQEAELILASKVLKQAAKRMREE